MASLVLCGEGPSDFGKEGEYGSLALVVFKTLEYLACEQQVEYKMPEIKRFYCKNIQPTRDKDANNPIARRMNYARRKHSILRERAKSFAERYVKLGDIGIFHSDVDFDSQENGNTCHECIIEDIKKGFALAKKSDCCCAMVPMPRTEAWLLYLTPENRLSPQQIERLPGNDRSPNAPKTTLCNLGYVTDNCGLQRNRNKKLSFIIENHFDYDKMIKLTAYKQFYEDFSSMSWADLF